MSEQSERSIWYKVDVSDNSTRPESARPSGFCEPYISASVRVMIFKQRPPDMRTFLSCSLSNFHSNQESLVSMKSIQKSQIF